MGERQNLGLEQVAIVVPAEKFPDVMTAIGHSDGPNLQGGDVWAFTGEAYDIVPIAAEPKPAPELVRKGEALTARARVRLGDVLGELMVMQADIAQADDDFQDVFTVGPVDPAVETDHAIAGIVATRISNALEELRFALEMLDFGSQVKGSIDVSDRAARRAVPTVDGREQEEF